MADTALANGCCCLHFLMKACSKGSPPIYIASLLPYVKLPIRYVVLHYISYVALRLRGTNGMHYARAGLPGSYL